MSFWSGTDGWREVDRIPSTASPARSMSSARSARALVLSRCTRAWRRPSGGEPLYVLALCSLSLKVSSRCRHVLWNGAFSSSLDSFQRRREADVRLDSGGYFGVIFQVRGLLPKAEVRLPPLLEIASRRLTLLLISRTRLRLSATTSSPVPSEVSVRLLSSFLIQRSG